MIFIPGFKHFKYVLRKNLVIFNYLLKEFPDEKTYQDSKEKIKEL